MSVAIEGAAQVLLPPSDGMRFARGVEGFTLEPGGLTLADGRVAALSASDGVDAVFDASGCAVVPGFVDCHTHLPFAGWRAQEYEMKATGVAYEQIARRGGGIRSSAAALRAASDAEVLAQARGLAAEMLAHGTTTFETKCGYGLSRDAELRALRLARELDVVQPLVHTALLAHAVPDGYDADGWIEEVAAMLPVDAAALDIFVESIAFSNEHLARMGELAREHGYALRAHVEQLNDNGSVPIALEAGAISVDHLACLRPAHVEPLALSECAAVLLPGAEFMGDERVAPARALLDAGAICVLATDANPGTSPIVSLPLICGLAVRRYGWSALEALVACTLNAAWVLRVSDVCGSLEVGKRGDVVVLDGPVEHVPYRFGHNPVAAVFSGGREVWVRPDFASRRRGGQ